MDQDEASRHGQRIKKCKLAVGRGKPAFIKDDPYGTRTRVAAVKGQCPRPLDEGAVLALVSTTMESIGSDLMLK